MNTHLIANKNYCTYKHINLKESSTYLGIRVVMVYTRIIKINFKLKKCIIYFIAFYLI